MVATAKLINNGKSLITSGRVWFLDSIASHLGVTAKGPCWPFLLSFCSDANRPSRCPSWGHLHHESVTSAAHLLKLKPGKTFDLQELANGSQFCRHATAQEKASVAPNRPADQPGQPQPSQPSQPSPARGRGRGRGRGRDAAPGRGRGRGRGGRSAGQTVTFVDEATFADDDEGSHFRTPSVE